MGYFRIANDQITIDNGVDIVQFSAEDAERCVPWVGQLPVAMIYTQGGGSPASGKSQISGAGKMQISETGTSYFSD